MQTSGEPEAFTALCLSYPVFKLTDCSHALQDALGISPKADTLVETFDPHSGVNGRWIACDPSTPRTITSQPCLLYRARGIVTGVDMQDEIEKVCTFGKSRKRPIDMVINSPLTIDRHVRPKLSAHGPKPRTSPDLPTPPSRKTSVSRHPVSKVVHLLDSDSEDESNSSGDIRPFPGLPVKQEDATGTMTLANLPEPRCSTSAPFGGINSSLDEDLAILARKPASNHSSWPFMFVASMAEGFGNMETLSGDLPTRFRAAFGLDWKKTTWNTHSCVWEAANDAEKQIFVAAGYTKAGTWRAFTRTVEARYGGKVPRKRTQGKAGPPKQAAVIKSEFVEVINIDSD